LPSPNAGAVRRGGGGGQGNGGLGIHHSLLLASVDVEDSLALHVCRPLGTGPPFMVSERRRREGGWIGGKWW
jgi:hypothetical protein